MARRVSRSSCNPPPAKVLLLGGDLLLANDFPGSKKAKVSTIIDPGRPKRRPTQGPDHSGNKAPKLALDLDEVTLGTETCTVERPGLNYPGIGFCLTEEDDVQEHTPVPNPIDVTFILEQDNPL